MSYRDLLRRARSLFPGGVNSPVRAFGAVGSDPIFVERGKGAWVFDVEGRPFVDYVMSWGALIFGHAPDFLVEAACEAAGRGTSFGLCSPLEVEMAELIREAIPSLEVMRFTSSGTEAVMSAVRLARACTGRRKVVKFEGCYHGHSDSLLVRAGSGAMTFGVPTSPGVLEELASHTVCCAYNDLGSVERAFELFGDDVAAVLVEPVAGNMGLVEPRPGFLEGLRELCSRRGALLIFDEVITGFRFRYGGYQGLCGVEPDLTCLGKIVGGGMPFAVYGGRADLMRHLSPEGPVYQAGTLSGNPMALSLGIAVLRRLKGSRAYEELEEKGSRLEEAVRRAASRAGVEVTVNRLGSAMTVFFASPPVEDLEDVRRSDASLYGAFFRGMLRRGVLFPPSQFECAFVSLAHGEEELSITERALEETFDEIRSGAG